MVWKLKGPMYLLRNGQGYRSLKPQPFQALQFVPKNGINMGFFWPEHKLQASVISKRGELWTGSIGLHNPDYNQLQTASPFKKLKRITFLMIYWYDQHTKNKKKRLIQRSMIHDFSLILPNVFSSRKLLNVYNMETLSMSRWLGNYSWQITLYIVDTMLNVQFIVFGGFGSEQPADLKSSNSTTSLGSTSG